MVAVVENPAVTQSYQTGSNLKILGSLKENRLTAILICELVNDGDYIFTAHTFCASQKSSVWHFFQLSPKNARLSPINFFFFERKKYLSISRHPPKKPEFLGPCILELK